MFSLSEQDKLNAYFEVYSNVRYNIAKKRRELEMTIGMASILSGVSPATLNRIEQCVSETQDIRLSSLIDVCTLFGMSIQDVFAARPEVDSEESKMFAELLTRPKVSPSMLPKKHQNDFCNYVGDDKFVDRTVFASWYRIITYKNHAEPKEKLNPIMSNKIKLLDIGKPYKYNKKYHPQAYALIRTLKDKDFELRYLDTEFNTCTRIR